MKKHFKKQPPRILSRKKSVKFAKQVPRSWGLATKLEHQERKIKNR
jgi:hypothetical protein